VKLFGIESSNNIQPKSDIQFGDEGQTFGFGRMS